MLRDRNVALVVAARFVSRAGGEAAFFVGIWGKAAFEFGANPAQLAVLMATLSISVLIGSTLSGLLIDRFDPKRVMIVGEILFVPATLSILLAGDLAQLTLTAALLGFFGAPVFTAVNSFAPYITEDDKSLEKANGLIEAAGQAAFIAGPALGAFIATFATIDLIFVFDAATSLVAVALIVFVSIHHAEQAERSGGFQQLREGLSYSYRTRQLRFYILLGTSLWLAFGAFGALEPLYFRDVLEVEVAVIGWVNTIFGAGLVAGSLALTRLPTHFTSARTATVILGLNAIGVFLYVGTDELAVVTIGAAVWGILIGLLMPMVRTLIHLNSPEKLIGRIQGTVTAQSTAAELIPLAFAPAMAAWLGVQTVLVGTGLLVAAVAIVAYREAAAIDRIREKPVPPPQPATVADEPISPNP